MDYYANAVHSHSPQNRPCAPETLDVGLAFTEN